MKIEAIGALAATLLLSGPAIAQELTVAQASAEMPLAINVQKSWYTDDNHGGAVVTATIGDDPHLWAFYCMRESSPERDACTTLEPGRYDGGFLHHWSVLTLIVMNEDNQKDFRYFVVLSHDSPELAKKPFFGAKLLCDIDVGDIEEYQRNRLQSGAEGRTVNIEVSTLRHVLKANDMWQPLAGKVRMLRERHDVAKVLTPEQEHALLRATAEKDSACHTATVLALNTTMRKNEIRQLRWEQVDFEKRALVVGDSKTDAGTGRLITLNPPAFDVLVRWAGRFPEVKPEHYVFPWCENRHIDPSRPTKGWRTAWRRALKGAGFHCRFHDLRHTCITKLAESQASDMTIMSIAGHVSKKMLERYSHIRVAAKRAALDAIAKPVSDAGVAQNWAQLPSAPKTAVPN